MNLQIPQRFSCPNWSIVDLWIAKALLVRGMTDAPYELYKDNL